MTTSENMTPSDIAKEEMAGSNDEGALCYQYLQEYERKLGVDNDCSPVYSTLNSVSNNELSPSSCISSNLSR